MVIDVRAIPQGRSTLSRTLTEFQGDEEWPPFVDGLHCRCDFDRTQDEIFATLSFKAKVVLCCSRCLEEYEQAIEGISAVIVHERGDSKYGDSAGDEVDEYTFDEDTSDVDVGQTLFDGVMTAIPMKPLCSETCRGVQRGNDGQAAGSERAVDPRWEALRKLKERGEG
jgi:uncharacterized protein